ncbi:alpha/beta-hydrolase [Tothia fuscella]|uniref:Alpha/beta-hydrolase n=1 Tax=Tothia fuscella TaxID=1048955 RepID=A0A9P4NX62_9PEZI|nr:alpha/beta-hydrolase [Tothia fuscella]
MYTSQMEAALERPPIPARRAWLDAVHESGSTSINQELPPMPIPPLSSQHSPTFAAPDYLRRRSANPSPNSNRKKRSSKSATTSPEIISNLIDSLDNIDFSTQDFLAPSTPITGTRASRTAPGTPVLRPKRSFGGDSLNSKGFRGFSQDYSAYRNALSEEFKDVDLDDAAEPPVIRTSKRPSGYSELTAPKEKKATNGLSSYIRNGYARSTSSLASARDDDTHSLGNGSTETTVRRRSITNTSRDSLESRMSGKKPTKGSATQESQRSNMGSTREVAMLGPGLPSPIAENLYSPRASAPTIPRHLHPFDALIEEESSYPAPIALSRPSERSKREGKKPVVENSPPSPIGGPIVPSRRSSLRAQEKSPKIGSDLLSSKSTPGKATDTLAEVEESRTGAGLAISVGGDTDVTKRIKELKARKEMREKEARASLTPSPVPDTAAREGYFSRHFSQNSSRSPDNRSLGKFRKGGSPGNIFVPPSGPIIESQASKLIAQQERPLTPLTPTALPINYSYVVDTLNRESPHSPPASIAPSAKDSIQTTSTQNGSTRPTDQRKSVAVGGRSAAGRTKATKIIKRSTSPPMNGRYGGNSSPNIEGGLVDALDPATLKPKRGNSLLNKQRRWSHPDMPLGMERNNSNNSQKTTDTFAVRPPETVTEERPSSRDSIDLDVNAFMHAGRLSQKIRHPSGRTIAFSEVGDPKGHAVFCCVGMGLTRYVTAFYDELAVTLRLRLITPDRPGVGESQADSNGQPLTWPDDVAAICTALNISKFSIMAHSAGAIYALATALRMPQHIRGRVHLLAPWIPPSQMAPIGITKQDPPPGAQLPKSQRFLRALPAPFLKVANTGFLSLTSASLSPNGSNSPSGRKKRKSVPSKEPRDSKDSKEESRNNSPAQRGPNSLFPPGGHIRRESIMLMDQQNMPDGSAITAARSTRDLHTAYGPASNHATEKQVALDEVRRETYDSRLTLAIWDKATTNANPAVDLIICLERHQPIGFMYKDITRAVVIHHGSKDTRVPVENVRWLGSAMRRCEVRVLEGQGHGLMAMPTIMGGVLEEVGREWADWEEAVRRGGEGDPSFVAGIGRLRRA